MNYTEPFGEQVQPGAVDGYARIKGDHGFIFLFNGNPRPAEITFEVGDEINLQAKGDYQFAELYPSEKSKLVLDSNGKSVFALGEKASIIVPANGCYLLELKRVMQQSGPVLVGAAGEVALADGRTGDHGYRGQAGRDGQYPRARGRSGAVQSVTVNGIAQKFTRTKDEICLELQFAGENYVRELDAWTQADGKRFDFPYHAAQPELKLTTTFKLNADVRQLLEKAKPKNFAEMDAKIAVWQTPSREETSYSYHNFICERPSRLWLIVPFLTPTGVEATLNGEKVDTAALGRSFQQRVCRCDRPRKIWRGKQYHDVHQWHGAQPIHGAVPPLSGGSRHRQAAAGSGQADQRVVYKQSLVPAPATPLSQGCGTEGDRSENDGPCDSEGCRRIAGQA